MVTRAYYCDPEVTVMKQIKHNMLVYPRGGSDYAFLFSDKREDSVTAAFGVLDTIGDKKVRQTRRYFKKKFQPSLRDLVRDPSIENVNMLADRVKALILQGNVEIRNLGLDIPDQMFGFCFNIGMIHGSQYRSHWLGDCRGYLLRMEEDSETGAPRPIIRCLSRDHNRLNDILEENGEYVFLRNELAELSRKLTFYWGMKNDADLRTLLDLQNQVTNLREGDVILQATDGIYLPFARARMQQLNFRMTPDVYYLEEEITGLLESLGYFGSADTSGWRHRLLRDFLHASLRCTVHKRRYRDDVSALSVHL